MVRSTTQHCLCWPRKFTVLTKKETNLIAFMVNAIMPMLIAKGTCWYVTFDVEFSTRKLKSQQSIYGRIGTPLVTQQLTWWFKVHLSRKAHVSRAMLISKLECWWTIFDVELLLIKLKSKVLTIALRTTKLNCKVECWSLSSQMLHSQVECCDLLWFLAGMEFHTHLWWE